MQDKLKEIHVKTYHRTFENERQRKCFEGSQSKNGTLLLGENNSDDNGFLIRNQRGQKEMAEYLYVLSGKCCQARILYAAELYFKSEGKIKMFSDEGKLIEFVTERPMLKVSKGSSQNIKGTVQEGTWGRQKKSTVRKNVGE